MRLRLGMSGLPFLLAALHVASGSDDPEFTVFEGYIAGDDDARAAEYVTLTQAKEKCVETPACRGFTYMGGPSEGPMWVNFKATWNVGGTGWTSYRREDLPFTMFDGYLAGDGELEHEYTSLRKAKARCAQLAGCKGFTFMGGPSEGPMWIKYFDRWNVGGTGWTSWRYDDADVVKPAKPAAEPAVAVDSKAQDAGAAEPAAKETLSAERIQAKTTESSESAAAKDDKAESTTTPLSMDTTSANGVVVEPTPKHSSEDQMTSKPTGVALSEGDPTDETMQAFAANVDSDVSERHQIPKTDSSSAPTDASSTDSASTAASQTVHISIEEPAAPKADAPASSSSDTVEAGIAPKTNVPSNDVQGNATTQPSYRSTLFAGDLSTMTTRKMLALSIDNVVMCYTQPELGGACKAANASSHPQKSAGTLGREEQLLPPLQWGQYEVFNSEQTGHIEAVRLNANRFVVCFERVADAAISCVLAFVTGQSSDKRLKFGNSLSVGSGRIISAVSSSAGQKFVACHAAKSKTDVVCRWADTIEGSGADDATLRWADTEPQHVQW